MTSCGCARIRAGSWSAPSTSPGTSRTATRAAPRALVEQVREMDMRTARAELALVHARFRGAALADREGVPRPLRRDRGRARPRRARDPAREEAADRRLFLPRIQLCRRGADEPQRGAAPRPERAQPRRGALRHVAARGRRGPYLLGRLPRGDRHPEARARRCSPSRPSRPPPIRPRRDAGRPTDASSSIATRTARSPARCCSR